MIRDFFTKPLGGARFQRLRNIIMNCECDDFCPVNMDKLMAEHNKRISNRHDVSDDEPTISKTSDTVGSQKCVGLRPEFRWAQPRKAYRNAHQDITKGKTMPHSPHCMRMTSLDRGELPPPTGVQIAVE
jgi:hypothetical protein